MKVVNVEKQDVFKCLSEDLDVYRLDTTSDDTINLKYETVDCILNRLTEDKCVYFVVEK